MPSPKIDDQELLDRLIEIFRAWGYEGASLSRIASATGLQRASLYHRFPGGKEQMAEAVLSEIERRYAVVLASLQGTGSAAERVLGMAERLGEFYMGGKSSCILDSLSFSDATPGLRERVSGMLTAWRKAMASVARDAGASPAQARRLAEDAIVRVEGSLVIARATGETGPFKRALASLPELLVGGA